MQFAAFQVSICGLCLDLIAILSTTIVPICTAKLLSSTESKDWNLKIIMIETEN